MEGGHLRLQGCDVSSRAENALPSLEVSGSSTHADALGCTFRGGGGDGIWFSRGATGRVEGCDFRGFSRGSGISLRGAGTSLLVSRNTIRDCTVGVHIRRNVDPAWSLGEGKVFVNCAGGDVVDERNPPPLPPPGPPPLASRGVASPSAVYP